MTRLTPYQRGQLRATVYSDPDPERRDAARDLLDADDAAKGDRSSTRNYGGTHVRYEGNSGPDNVRMG